MVAAAGPVPKKALSLLDDEWWESKAPWCTAVADQASSPTSVCILDDAWWNQHAPWAAALPPSHRRDDQVQETGATRNVATPRPEDFPALPLDLLPLLLEQVGLPILKTARQLSGEWRAESEASGAKWQRLLTPPVDRVGSGLLDSAESMALLPDGSVAVTDFHACCVEVFSPQPDGTFLHVRTLGERMPDGPLERHLPLGQFSCCKGLASDARCLFICDYYGDRVQALRHEDGKYHACAAGQLRGPHGLARGCVGDKELLFVSESGGMLDQLDTVLRGTGTISVVDARARRR